MSTSQNPKKRKAEGPLQHDADVIDKEAFRKLDPDHLISHLKDNYNIQEEMTAFIKANAIHGRGLLEVEASVESLLRIGVMAGPAIHLANILQGIEKGKKCSSDLSLS